MGYQATVLKVMVSSPSDVIEERKIIHQALHNWNSAHSENENIILLPIDWKINSTPEMGAHPQEIINKQLVTTSDILIAVFWHRIGTPTKNHDSGTIDEINEFISTNKPVMLYFSLKPVPMSHDREQLGKLLAFKDSCKPNGLFFEYNSYEEFKELVSQHIQNKIGELKKNIHTNSIKPLNSLSEEILRIAVNERTFINVYDNSSIHIKTTRFGSKNGYTRSELIYAIHILLENDLIFDATNSAGTTKSPRKYGATKEGVNYILHSPLS